MLPLLAASPGGARARLSILIFHRVLAAPDPLLPDVPTSQDFERTMRWVSDWFNVLPLRVAIERLYDGSLPSRSLAITFDDGYADNEKVAAPVLQRLGLTATFFVASGYLRGGNMWNDLVIESIRDCGADRLDLRDIGLDSYSMVTAGDRRTAIHEVLVKIKHREQADRLAATESIRLRCGGKAAPELMMRLQQVRALRDRGMDIGAHTVTHPILTRLSSSEALKEMHDSKLDLEEILQSRVGLFAYPNGVPGRDYSSAHVAMAKECGYDAAFSTAWGAADRSADRYQLPRFTPWDRTRFRFGARMFMNLLQKPLMAA